MRACGMPALVTIPPSASLADVVFRRSREEPGTVVMRRQSPGADWQDVTAAAFRAEVEALARGMIAAGIEPGDRIGLMSRTRYEWTLIDYAIWAAGAVTVPVYETSSADQAAWILGDSEACAVFFETDQHEKIISGVRDRLPGLRQAWAMGRLDALSVQGARVSKARLDDRRACRTAADLATIIYTSGTTGPPKGCPLTHGNLLGEVRNAAAALPELFAAPDSATLLFLPLAHVFARIIQIGALEAGAILGHWPDPASLTAGLTGFRPTFVLAVPRVFEKIHEAADRQAMTGPFRRRIFATATRTAVAWSAAADLPPHRRPGLLLRLRHALFDRLVYRRLRAALGGRVQYAISGGAALSEHLGHFFRGAGLTVLEGYGLTESTGAATVNRPACNKIGTVGRPLPGVDIQIARDGEILVRGPGVFAGYGGERAVAGEAVDADGWLHTGDTGRLDGQGFLRVTGRSKDLIITAGGTNLAPTALEDRIRAHPLVSRCAVIGEGRPYVTCLVTLDREALAGWKQQHHRPGNASPGDLASDPALIAEIQQAVDDANRTVSRAESVRRFRVLGADFTEASGQLTPSDKVCRDAVIRDFGAEIEELYREPR
jgi:long-chain acyl-CoA synthetase